MWFKFCYWLVYILLKPIYRFRVYGRERLPEGGVVVCANHTALVDAVLLVLSLGPQGNFAAMGKAELFKNPILGALLKSVHVFPVQRGKNDVGAIKHSLKALKDGKQLVIFPEGTRVHEGQTAEAKTGAGMLALRSGVPVMPVYITAGKKAFRGCQLIYGTPFAPTCEGRPGPDDYQRVTDDIMKGIAAAAKRELSA